MAPVDVDLLDRVRETALLADRETARRAVRAVVCALRERLEGQDLDELRTALGPEAGPAFDCHDPRHTHTPAGRARDRLSEPEMVARLQEDLGLGAEDEARRVLRVVLSAVAARLSESEAEVGNEARSVGSLGRHRGGRGGGNDDA